MILKAETGSKDDNLLASLPGRVPVNHYLPQDPDIIGIAKKLLKRFPSWNDHDFTDGSLWRDTYALTGTMRTFFGVSKISEKWKLLTSSRDLGTAEVTERSGQVMSMGECSWIQFRFTFSCQNPSTQCSAFVSMIPDENAKVWKIWMLRTVLEDICETSVDHPPKLPAREPELITVESETIPCYDAVVVGGGQSGLSTGGRLQTLGLSYVILEKNAAIGDAWGNRYESCKLHTIREYSHLPFERTFGPEYGEYLSKTELAAGHKQWAERYGINVMLSTTLESGKWNEESRLYHLSVRSGDTLKPICTRNIVFATGAGSESPVQPDIPGRDEFQGTVLHSVQYKHCGTEWQGKSGIVVGTANTGHDVADDMYQAGMRTTMVQRNRTFVLPVEYIEAGYKRLYNSTLPTELSDRLQFSTPVAISRQMTAYNFHAQARAQPERWEALEQAGFKVDPYGDLQHALFVRLGGHYIDIGTSAKIAKGLINIKSQPIERFSRHGLIFSDGSEVKADLIVFATGFVGNLRDHVQKIFGEEVANRAGDCFGVDEEGEVLGVFKPLQQPGMFYLGGALGHSRYYSRFIALSIKADCMNAPLPRYEEA